MLLVDEKYANENKKIAAKMEKIFQDHNCEEYQVADSNMDMSSMMGSGLSVNIYGKDTEKLIKISEDVMKMANVDLWKLNMMNLISILLTGFLMSNVLLVKRLVVLVSATPVGSKAMSPIFGKKKTAGLLCQNNNNSGVILNL